MVLHMCHMMGFIIQVFLTLHTKSLNATLSWLDFMELGNKISKNLDFSSFFFASWSRVIQGQLLILITWQIVVIKLGKRYEKREILVVVWELCNDLFLLHERWKWHTQLHLQNCTLVRAAHIYMYLFVNQILCKIAISCRVM